MPLFYADMDALIETTEIESDKSKKKSKRKSKTTGRPNPSVIMAR
jgi:hypothetical protein